ncbi:MULTISPECIES: MerR family transcriptional regulator [unclassified Kribbella]|uniref:MerR family transcriptional regulator n=1 Tax=unclassified Kribbella TaxID=2644121 RepID=UPI0033F18BF1
MDYSIGELARRAGVSVKTVRYYSDQGLLTARRTAAGHRRYDGSAPARLELIRTLRALGIDLATVRAVLDQERTLADVLTAHADAVAVQIRTLQLQHAVLSVVARRHSTPEDLELMHELTTQSEQQRHALIADFLTSTLGDDPGLAAVRQNLTPVLSEDADADQVEAWLELAALVQDDAFRSSVRRMAVGYRALGDDWRDPEFRGRLIELRRTEADPRWDRYLELLAVVNGWAPPSRVAG